MGEQAEPQVIDTCMWLGKISSITGKAFFLLFIISSVKKLSVVGLMYIGFAGLIDGIFLIVLLVVGFMYRIYWHKILAPMFFMLANIPLCIFYCFIALKSI